jgi:hypothetical protein
MSDDIKKLKVESIIELYKIQMDHFEKSRDIEFKINLALWTLIVLAGKFGYGKQLFSIESYCLMAGTVLGLHIFWMVLIQRSQDRDIEWRDTYKEEIRKAIRIPFKKPEEPWCWLAGRWRKRRWVVCEVGITAVLLTGLGVILMAPVPCDKGKSPMCQVKDSNPE